MPADSTNEGRGDPPPRQRVQGAPLSPIPQDYATREKIVEIINQQFRLEEYLKWQEIRKIEENICKTEALLDIVRSAALNERQYRSMGTFEAINRSRWAMRSAAIEASRLLSRQQGAASAVRSERSSTASSTCYARRHDGKFVRIVCPGCGRPNFATFQGFINHCRITHQIEFSNHAEAAKICGVVVEDESEIPQNHPVRRQGPMAAPIIPTNSDQLSEGMVTGFSTEFLASQLSESQRSSIQSALKGLSKPTIKVYEEEVDFDEADTPKKPTNAGKGMSRTRPASQEAQTDNPERTPSASTPALPFMSHLVRESRFHIMRQIIVGNSSKYIPVDKRDPNYPDYTHRWTLTVRTPLNDPPPGTFIKKTRYFLHPSYRPNDIIDVVEPFSFKLTRLGWGEFPVRLQLFFTDKRNKPVDVILMLQLDKSHCGREVLGASKIVDVELDRLSKLRDTSELGGAEDEGNGRPPHEGAKVPPVAGTVTATAGASVMQHGTSEERGHTSNQEPKPAAPHVGRVSLAMAAGDTEAKAASEQRLRDPIHPLLGLIVALACRAFPLTLNDPTPLGLRSEKGVSDHALADPTIFHPVNPKVRDTILPVMKEALSPSGQNCLGTRDYDIAASQVVWRRDWPLGKRLAVEHQRARSIYELIVPVIFGDRSRPLRKVTRLLRQPPPQPVRAFDTARDAAGLETPAQPSAPLVAPVVGKIVLDKQQATECLISFLRALEVDEHVIVAVREILPLLDGKEMTSVLRVVNAWQKKGPVFVKRWLRDHCFTPDVASCDVLPGADDARGLSSGPDTADTSHDVRLAAKEPTRAAYYRDSDVPASEKRQRELDSDEGDVKRQRRLSLITEAREASSASADSGSDDKQRRIRYYCRACGRLASQGMSEGTEICAVPRFCCQACEQVWTGSTLSQMSTLTPLADLLVQLPGGADGLAGDDGGMSGGGLGSDDSDGDLDVDGSMPMARLTATRPSLQSSSPSSSIALFANDVGGQGELVSGLWEAAMMDDGASASVLTDWVWSSIQPLELPTTPAARMAVTQRNDDQGSPMARVPVKRGTSTRPLKHTDELRQTFEHDGKEILLANSTKDVLFEAISQRVVVGKLLVDTVKLFLRDLVRSALKEIPDAPGCQGKGWQIIPPSRAINVHQKTSANSTSVKTVELPAAILTPWHVVKAIQRNPSTFDVCSNTYLGVDPVHSSDVLDL